MQTKIELKTLAAEMIARAEAAPLIIDSLDSLIESQSFRLPKEFSRTETVEKFGAVHVQYSHDQFSEKTQVLHLSFSKQDNSMPDSEMIIEFQEAFFGINDVIRLPSFIPHVVQLGKLDNLDELRKVQF